MSLATRRLLGIAALLAVALVVSWAWTNPATRSAARACCLYRPSMALHHGRVWTVVTSAFLLVNPHPFGTTVLFSALVLVPYALRVGSGRALAVFLIGHVVTTLAVAVASGAGAVAGWAPAVRVFHATDVGMSAGLAAVAGALSADLARGSATERRVAALAALVVVGRLLVEPAQGRFLVGAEHLVALATGAGYEWHRRVHLRAERQLEARSAAGVA